MIGASPNDGFEQNANQALKLADRGYVLENGHVVLEDTGDALLANT
jgi:branched-chain amino acid transport system ATP-binding protein